MSELDERIEALLEELATDEAIKLAHKEARLDYAELRVAIRAGFLAALKDERERMARVLDVLSSEYSAEYRISEARAALANLVGGEA